MSEQEASVQAATEAQAVEAQAYDALDGELPLSLRALIDSGVHFGHQTKRWNPKMKPFIYGSRNGIHIIDLDQTANLFKRAYQFASDAVARGGHVLFVGTKRQAAEIIVEEATRGNQFFVTGRWLGGTLTNFRTIKQAIEHLRDIERMQEDGTIQSLTKKEALGLEREKVKLDKYLGGIKNMNGIPAAVFVIDPGHEHIAIKEARRLGIPVIAITDTNCDPDVVDFVIPGNDDAIRSIKLITGRIADACLEGLQRRREGNQGGRHAEGRGGESGVAVEFSRGRRGGGGGGGGGRGRRNSQAPSTGSEGGGN